MRSKAKRVGIICLLTAVLLLAAAPLAAQEGWRKTEKLVEARAEHTETTLMDGRVLLAGGGTSIDFGIYSETCELYDPIDDVWSMAASMNVKRSVHRAILMPDGKVIVIGGFWEDEQDEDHYLDTAEIYDPVADTWTMVDSTMSELRLGHTATLLANDKILVAGGQFKSGVDIFLNSADLYDIASGTFSPAGTMVSRHSVHTADILLNGKVLVAGGIDSFITQNKAELYDPASNTWSSAANMNTSRAGHASTMLLDGRIMVSGGMSGFVSTDTTEIYDPGTDTWTAVGFLNEDRALHRLTTLKSGKVLATGGAHGFYTTYDTLWACEVYDPATQTWAAIQDLSQNRQDHTATLLNSGEVMVTGGLWHDNVADLEVFRRGVEIYMPPSIPCGILCTASANTSSGTAPLDVQFNTRTKLTGCTSVATYAWTFGDGGTSAAQNPAHTYQSAGTFEWTVTVMTDDQTCESSGFVTVEGAPTSTAVCTFDPTVYTPEQPVLVSIAVEPDPGTNVYAVEDTPPAGWTVAGITQGGSWDAVNAKVKWGPYFDSTSRILQYNATPPAGATGTKTFEGVASFDGTSVNITGDRSIDATAPTCTLSCMASAPVSATVDSLMVFTGQATANNCSGQPAFHWDFGDGNTSSEQSPTHAYTAVGSYTWTLTVTVDGETCPQSGTISINSGGGLPGDCNGDGTVSIGEVQKVIRMHLRLDPVGCGADCDGNGQISIGEVQKAIRAHLRLSSTC